MKNAKKLFFGLLVGLMVFSMNIITLTAEQGVLLGAEFPEKIGFNASSQRGSLHTISTDLTSLGGTIRLIFTNNGSDAIESLTFTVVVTDINGQTALNRPYTEPMLMPGVARENTWFYSNWYKVEIKNIHGILHGKPFSIPDKTKYY